MDRVYPESSNGQGQEGENLERFAGEKDRNWAN